MKIDVASLRDALHAVLPAASKKTTQNAILGSALLKDGKVTCTDMQVQMSMPVEGMDGISLCAPANRLYALLRELPDGEISLSKDEDRIRIAGASGRYSLPILDADEFPQMERPEGDPVEIDAQALRAAMKICLRHAATNDVRYVLNGVLFELSKGVLRMVATDGHRLASLALPAAYEGQTVEAIIPVSSAHAMLGLLDEGAASVTINEKSVRLTTPDGELTSLLVSGKYPEWRKVVPKPAEDATFSVAADDLASAVRRMIALTSGAAPVKIEIGAEVKVKATRWQSEDAAGSGSETLHCNQPPGAKCANEVSINSRYLLDSAESAAGRTMTIQVPDSESGILVRVGGADDLNMVIMPMRA